MIRKSRVNLFVLALYVSTPFSYLASLQRSLPSLSLALSLTLSPLSLSLSLSLSLYLFLSHPFLPLDLPVSPTPLEMSYLIPLFSFTLNYFLGFSFTRLHAIFPLPPPPSSDLCLRQSYNLGYHVFIAG